MGRGFLRKIRQSEVPLPAAAAAALPAAAAPTNIMNQQQVYIITETDNLEDTTDIVSVHGTPARALIEMQNIALRDGSYRQMVGDDAEWPFWQSPERTLEIDLRVVH